MQSVPGIQVDRVNVGGSESGQQSVYVGKGSQTTQGVWNVDGVTITDMGALGSSPAYYDFDSFEEIQVGTGGTDLSASTPGVQLNLVTKRGTNDYHGSARMLIEKDRWQSQNASSEFKEQAALGGVPASGNHISEVQDYGIEAGGPLWRDHAWLWASYGRQQIDLITAAGAPDKTTLEGVNGKFNVQFLESTAGTLFYSRDDNPLGIHVSVGQQKPYEGNFVVPVRVAVPIGKLGLIPVGDHYEGTFLVYVIAKDSDDKQSDLAIQRQVVTVPGKELTVAQAKDFYYDFSMTIGSGAQRVAIAVRDTNTNQTSYYQKNLFVSLLPKAAEKK